MPQVMYKCPEKGTAVPLGIELATRKEWDTISLAGKTIDKCPACGKTHEVFKRDAFLSDFATAR